MKLKNLGYHDRLEEYRIENQLEETDLIDNPGMREVGTTDAKKGTEAVFNRIAMLSEKCRFRDCTHTTESGCAVLEALNKGELDRDSYENYLKLEREREYFESSLE